MLETFKYVNNTIFPITKTAQYERQSVRIHDGCVHGDNKFQFHRDEQVLREKPIILVVDIMLKMSELLRVLWMRNYICLLKRLWNTTNEIISDKNMNQLASYWINCKVIVGVLLEAYQEWIFYMDSNAQI